MVQGAKAGKASGWQKEESSIDDSESQEGAEEEEQEGEEEEEEEQESYDDEVAAKPGRRSKVVLKYCDGCGTDSGKTKWFDNIVKTDPVSLCGRLWKVAA